MTVLWRGLPEGYPIAARDVENQSKPSFDWFSMISYGFRLFRMDFVWISTISTISISISYGFRIDFVLISIDFRFLKYLLVPSTTPMLR